MNPPVWLPTPEQRAIEQAFNQFGYPNLKVVARAGSGKTATARYLTHSASRKGVYLAFGKKNADEARARFPSHMLVKTTHALAHAAMNVRSRWGHKLKNDSNKWPLWRVIREFGIHEEDGISAEHSAYAAMQGLRCFLYSADPELTASHVYDRSKDEDYFAQRLLDDYRQQHPMATAKAREHWAATVLPERVKTFRQHYTNRLLSLAQDLWEAQISTTHPYPIEHDTYLKLWQLSQPIIPEIDYLIADEAQDLNACILDIILKQPCQIVMIGDPAQGIFGFRRAINGFELLDAQTLYLSLSFRFGQVIADVANAILRVAYPDLVPIRGNPLVPSRLGPISSGRYALVARTNAGLFDEAVELARKNQRFHVVGSLKDPIERARSVYHLWAGSDPKWIRHPDIKPYDDWNTLKKEAQYDVDLARHVRLIADREDEVLELCDLLENAGEVRANQADVVLTTVHKSKGLEYPQVRMADDFSRLKIDENGQLSGPLEEIHVLYVAVTRAERQLELNSLAEAAYSPRNTFSNS
jgi:superfamily I DNA/RNA helicase